MSIELTWKSPPLFAFRANRRELVARFGQPHDRDLDSNGWGLFDSWLLCFDCGLEFGVCQFQNHANLEPIEDDDTARPVMIHANARELEHLVFHLGIDLDAVEPWLHDPTHVGERGWTVFRQDDNGNTFAIESFTSECEAITAADSLTSRGHKQLYWVEKRS